MDHVRLIAVTLAERDLMREITRDNASEFLSRFNNFDDAVITSIRHAYEPSGDQVTAVV